jgi:cellulose synthase/poly-beta-1,6-N-acetylglucosamine synthase-like glycosyltransferase
MREFSRSWPLVAAIVAMVLLVAGAALLVSHALARSFNLLIYLVATSIALVDMLDMAMRIYLGRREGSIAPAADKDFTPRQKRVHLRPYAIVASIHNAQSNLADFMRTMAPYREHVWLIDDASNDCTVLMLKQAGWRCVESRVNRKKPGALRSLVATLPPEIESVLVIDPDITIRDGDAEGRTHLESLIFEFQRSDKTALCPRIAILEDGLLARFQGLEYCMSFSLGRRSLGDFCVNSGISLYRRRDLQMALDRHSRSVYAEDLENSLILLGDGKNIYYDERLVVDTEGKRTWREWFSQRVGWNYGLLRVYTQCFDMVRAVSRASARSSYHFLVYTGLFSILFQPLKIVALVLLVLGLLQGFDGLLGLDLIPAWDFADPAYVVGAYAKYTLIAFIALFVAVPPKERRALAPIVPLYFFYAVAQIVPVSVGYANWLSLRLRGKRLFADHYQEEATMMKAAGD